MDQWFRFWKAVFEANNAWVESFLDKVCSPEQFEKYQRGQQPPSSVNDNGRDVSSELGEQSKLPAKLVGAGRKFQVRE